MKAAAALSKFRCMRRDCKERRHGGQAMKMQMDMRSQVRSGATRLQRLSVPSYNRISARWHSQARPRRIMKSREETNASKGLGHVRYRLQR